MPAPRNKKPRKPMYLRGFSVPADFSDLAYYLDVEQEVRLKPSLKTRLFLQNGRAIPGFIPGYDAPVASYLGSRTFPYPTALRCYVSVAAAAPD
jgi:hypothetical protein